MKAAEQDELMRRLLRNARRIAVVGASPHADRSSHAIFRYLRSVGYDVVPVNPLATEVAGVKSVPDLASAGPVDLVDVFRRPERVNAVVTEAIATKAPAMWLQIDVVNAAAVARARAAGIEVVEDSCIMVEHQRLIR